MKHDLGGKLMMQVGYVLSNGGDGGLYDGDGERRDRVFRVLVLVLAM